MKWERGVILKTIAEENFPYLKKDNDTDIESAYWVPSIINEKTHHREISEYSREDKPSKYLEKNIR